MIVIFVTNRNHQEAFFADQPKNSNDISRRSFVKRTAMGGAGLLVATDALRSDLMAERQRTPKQRRSNDDGCPVRCKGKGASRNYRCRRRGTSLLGDLLAVENVEVKAICDLVPEKVAHAQKMVTDAGQPEPKASARVRPISRT